jgi:hypothetical protein
LCHALRLASLDTPRLRLRAGRLRVRAAPMVGPPAMRASPRHARQEIAGTRSLEQPACDEERICADERRLHSPEQREVAAADRQNGDRDETHGFPCGPAVGRRHIGTVPYSPVLSRSAPPAWSLWSLSLRTRCRRSARLCS